MIRSLCKVLLCLIALLGLLLPAAGCAAAPERCPDGQGVVAQFTAGPPSHLGARCSGDAAGVERRSVDGDARGVFGVVCPEGLLPAASPGTVKPAACAHGPCVQAEIVCLPTTSAGRSLRPSGPTQADAAAVDVHRRERAGGVYRCGPGDPGPGTSASGTHHARAGIDLPFQAGA